MITKYGNFSKEQIKYYKEYMRKQIFFLLLIVDKNTKEEYSNVDVNNVFESKLIEFNGINSILEYPKEMVRIMSLLESAYLEYKKKDFNWKLYRKLILDAGCAVLDLKEV